MIPTHKTTGSAGADVSAIEDVTILPGEYKFIKTGVFIPENMPKSHFLILAPRSSLCLKNGLIQPNSIGIIDADYPDEILHCFMNIGENIAFIPKGERIGQLVCVPFFPVFPIEDNERTGGFGSTNND